MPTDTLVREALEILSRPLPYATEIAPCHCALCEAARAEPFRCGVCGYHGTPLVHPCTCAQQRPEEIGGFGKLLRESEAGGREQEAEYCRSRLADLLTETPALCATEGRKQQCCHGAIECPVCCVRGDDDDSRWTDPENALHPWRIIRALRELLECEKR